MRMYYVYLHKRKGTNRIFYVGKGTKSKSGIDRIESHKNRNIWWQHVVDKDGGFDYEIYKDNLTEQEAFALETELIHKIGIDNLVNISDGGNGGNTLSHHPNILNIGKKISKANSGNKNPNYGKGYYYWWVLKYGKEEADKMEKKHRECVSQKQKGIPKGPSPTMIGDTNPAKRDDVRSKISNFAKNRIRVKVKCEKCGKEIPNTHLARHLVSKNCKTI